MEKKKEDVQIDFNFGGLLKGLGNFFELVNQMSEKGENQINRAGEITDLKHKYHGVYGFSVKLGLGGKPVVEEFGNIRKSETGPTVDSVREPLVDILDEGDHFVIITELPGIEEESISIDLVDDTLKIYASNNDRVYQKEIALPAVDPASRFSSYHNGILEIKFNKKKGS